VSGVALVADAAVLTRHPYPQSPKTDRVTLMWRTATPAAQTIDYGIGGFTQSYVEPVAVTAHEVTLTGLQPNRNYVYRLREGATIVTDPQIQYGFRTDGGRSDTDYTFFVTGDVGEDSPDIARQHFTDDMVRAISPRAEFGLLCGDIIYPDGESSMYDQCLMTPWRNLMASVPMFPALGNHDWHVDPELNFRKEWALPNNEHYYSFDWGNGHFIALDTADGFLYDEVNQLAWLEADLRAARGRAQWVFVYYHHPIYTCTYKENLPDLQRKLWPLFDMYKVDIVFNGHAHTFERLYPLVNGVPQNQDQNPSYVDPQGTMYIVTGAGGKFNNDAGEETTFCGPTAAFVDHKILFTQVFVFDQTLYVMTFDSMTGAVLDWTRISKTGLLTDVTVAPPVRALHQNVPNPFNPSTTIPFDVRRDGRVRLRVFRPDGALVADVLDRVLPAGTHQVTWNGRDARGMQAASGVYMCRMEADGGHWAIKMMLVR
jgi:hypothetical protein